ncbi:MAG: thioredoxin [Candidatus Cloacimonadota bacterium]|nr:MAG: thioredoxin [Candidatus Cloacimonadota bacterium]PIE78847.1 MAG: thioredoxin [Candidatus Delongbacteria bacterium]
MKKSTILSVVITALLLISSVAYGSEKKEGIKWLTSYDKAVELSKKEKKPIFVDFTGSDWCGWCMKLNDEVFSKKSFVDYLEKNFIPLELDFPSKKKQSEEIKEQNSKLVEKYSVRGFPTILILDKEGKVLAKTGYQQGGPDNYIKHIKEILKK